MVNQIKMKDSPSIFDRYVKPILSNLVPALISSYCLFIYYSDVSGKDFLHFAYMGYLAIFTNALAGFTQFLKDDSFCDLRVLLDYAQLVLPLPCLTTEIWLKHSVAPAEISVLHAAFGISAVIFYIVMEYKRQDLTDLALIMSMISMLLVGLLYENYWASVAALVFALCYFYIKRGETCCLKKQGMFNYSMALFSIISLAAFEPKEWLPGIESS